MDHSRPSGFCDASIESPDAIAIAATTSDRHTVPEEVFVAFSKTSGRADFKNTRTAPVSAPSTRPIAKCIGCINSAKVLKGSCVTPEHNVSSTTPKAPSCSATVQPSIDAAIIRAPLFIFFAIGKNISGYAMKHGKNPILNILQPSASIPPSANINA